MRSDYFPIGLVVRKMSCCWCPGCLEIERYDFLQGQPEIWLLWDLTAIKQLDSGCAFLSRTGENTCGGFFSGERFKKHEIDHQFSGHFHMFYCVSGHLNGQFLGFFKCSTLKNPPLGGEVYFYDIAPDNIAGNDKFLFRMKSKWVTLYSVCS